MSRIYCNVAAMLIGAFSTGFCIAANRPAWLLTFNIGALLFNTSLFVFNTTISRRSPLSNTEPDK